MHGAERIWGATVRRLLSVAIGWLVLALASASPAAAVDPGAVKLDRKTGCPLFYFPTQPQSPASPLLFPQHGEHCVQMPTPQVLPLQKFFPSTTPGGTGGCAGSLLVVESIPKGIDDYVVLPFSDIGLGTQILRPPGQQSIPIFNGVETYTAPRGSRVWGLGGGNYGGPCQPWDTHVLSTAAYGVTFKYTVSGTVRELGSEDPAPDVKLQARCVGNGGTTTTDDKGEYSFLVDKGPCTIEPLPNKGETIVPKRWTFKNVSHDITHVDFFIKQPILFFKVSPGLSVGRRTPGGHKLIVAGTSFTERVTLKNRSSTKTLVVFPIYPKLEGNADGGELQPVGGIVQHQLEKVSSANPSPIVLLFPHQKKEFDSVISTVASNSIGTTTGGRPASGGTRAYIQFHEPQAAILQSNFKLKRLDPKEIEVAKGSTDRTFVGIDDSAPDQTPFNGYLATLDIAKGLGLGFLHVTEGLVHSIFDLPSQVYHVVTSIPTGFINYVALESEVWQEVKRQPEQLDLLDQIVESQIVLMYKETPFLLGKVQNLAAGVNQAVARHFNKIEHDEFAGDWEQAYTDLADDAGQVLGNAATLVVTPERMAGALADGDLARVASEGGSSVLDAAEAARTEELSAEATTLAEELGPAANVVQDVEDLQKLTPGLPLNPKTMARTFGISEKNFADLAAFCEKHKVLVTLRSRAFEAIDLVESGVSVVKPAWIKLKTVTAEDIKWLGYTEAEKGQVVIRAPKFKDVQAFERYMVENGVRSGSPEFFSLRDRYVTRVFEWETNEPGYAKDLMRIADHGEVTSDWHWSENHVDPELAGTAETVSVRMAHTGDGGFIPQVFSDNKWKSVTGDIDLVSVTRADGSPLSDKEYVNLLKELGATSVQTQHPATATWYKELDNGGFLFDPKGPAFKEKAKYLQADKCCVLQVTPTGQALAVELNLKGSWFFDKNTFHLNYLGGYKAAAP